MADFTSKVQYVGNPARTYSQNNSKGWTFALNAWDLQILSGKLWATSGNYANGLTDINAGPSPLLSYDLTTGAIGGAGAGATTFAEDMFERLLVLNGELVIPGTDPRDGDAITYTKVESGVGRRYVATGGAGATSTVHTFDMAYWDSSYWATSATVGIFFDQAALGSVGVGGVTWTAHNGPAADGVGRSVKFLTLGADLYVQGEMLTTGSGGTSNYLYKVTPGPPRTFGAVAGSTYAYVSPTVPSSSFGGSPAIITRAVNFPDANTVIYIVAREDDAWTPQNLVKWTAGGSPTSILALLPNGATPRDLLVVGSTLYILGSYTSGSDTVSSVISTTNLTTFTELFSVRPNNLVATGYTAAQTFARSFAFNATTGIWYLGLGSTAVAAASQPANVGAILAFNQAWLPQVAQDWPQAAGNAQRTALQATEVVGPTISLAWRAQQHVLYAASGIRDRVHGQTGIIVSAGNVILPNLSGRIRSYATGAVGPTLRWTATVAGNVPIVSTGCSDGTNYYVADCYGRLSAFKLSDGTQATGWTNPVQVTTDREPIQGALLLAAGMLMVGGGDGKFHFRSPTNGAAVVAPVDVGAPIVQGAAWSNASGTPLAVVGCMDGLVRAFNTTTGALAWTSPALAGVASFKDYWPVIAGTTIVIRPQSQYPETSTLTSTSPPLRSIEPSDWTSDAIMTTALANYDANRSNYVLSMHVLNLSNGAIPAAPAGPPVHWHFAINMHGSAAPVVVDKDGYLVYPAHAPAGFNTDGQIGYGWVKSSLTTRKVVAGLVDPVLHRPFGAPDERMCASACSNGVFMAHIQGGNAQDTGFYNEIASTWKYAEFGAGSTLLYANMQGSGSNPPVISDGMVYHHEHPHTIVAIRSL